MFAADAGKLWVLNGVLQPRGWVESQVEGLPAGEKAYAIRQPEMLWRACEGIG